MKNIKFILLFGFLLLMTKGYSQNDTLIAKDGTVLVGEIKEMTRGVVSMETSFSDSDFKIEWLNVKKMISTRSFRVNLTNGDRLFGPIEMHDSLSTVVIIDQKYGEVSVAIESIVYIKHVEGGQVWDILNLALDVGYSYTKTNNLHQLNGSLNADYYTNVWGADIYATTVQNIQDDVDPISRNSAGLGLKLFFRHGYFGGLNADYFSNNEQRLDLRSNYDVSFGKFFAQTNKLYFSTALGIAYSIENYADTLPDRNSVEGKIGFELSLFDTGDLSMFTKLYLYPSITEKYRLRTLLNYTVKYDLPRDFYIKCGIDYNYDNKPIEGVDPDDYVITAGIGWEL